MADTRPYRPSNGSEGEFFMNEFCWRCIRDSEATPCEILGRALGFEIGHPKFPAEWIEDVAPYPDTNPRCTAFEAEEKP